MAATGEQEWEHWPSGESQWSGHDSRASASPLPTASPPSPIKESAQASYTPAPLYYAHGPPYVPQYHTYPPQPMHQPFYYGNPSPAPQGRYYTYTYAAPPSVPVPMPQDAIAPTAPTDLHVYQPAGVAAPQGPSVNRWMGRSKQEVEEDNMKIAKKEGAYDKRKMMPVDVSQDQLFWVIELDESQSLREFRYIQTLNGRWEADPRFPDSYYFIIEEEEKKKKKKRQRTKK